MNRGLENGSGWFDPVFKGFEDAGWYVSPRSQAVYIPLMSTPFFSEAAVSFRPPRIERRGLNKDVVVGGGRVEAGHASNLHEHKQPCNTCEQSPLHSQQLVWLQSKNLSCCIWF